MINVTAEQLQRILKTLDDAIVMHDKWRDMLQRTLSCRLPPPAAVLAEDAHRRCAFGHWFYSDGNAGMRKMPTLVEIGELHVAMHSNARKLCGRLSTQEPLPPADYDEWLTSLTRFRGALADLQHKAGLTLRNVDALTGAQTYQSLLPHLRLAQKKLKDNHDPYSLLLVDIDVKEINQACGREAGDHVLRQSILSIKEALSAGDIVFRYGGAEFVVCLPGRHADEAEQVREQLLKRIGKAAREVVGDSLPSFNIHHSVVPLDPKSYLEELLDRAARSTYTVDM